MVAVVGQVAVELEQVDNLVEVRIAEAAVAVVHRTAALEAPAALGPLVALEALAVLEDLVALELLAALEALVETKEGH